MRSRGRARGTKRRSRSGYPPVRQAGGGGCGARRCAHRGVRCGAGGTAGSGCEAPWCASLRRAAPVPRRTTPQSGGQRSSGLAARGTGASGGCASASRPSAPVAFRVPGTRPGTVPLSDRAGSPGCPRCASRSTGPPKTSRKTASNGSICSGSDTGVSAQCRSSRVVDGASRVSARAKLPGTVGAHRDPRTVQGGGERGGQFRQVRHRTRTRPRRRPAPPIRPGARPAGPRRTRTTPRVRSAASASRTGEPSACSAPAQSIASAMPGGLVSSCRARRRATSATLGGQPPGRLRSSADDRGDSCGVRVVDPVVEAAAFEGVVQVR